MLEKGRGLRVFHLADTHLGFSAYRKLDENGVNQREKDIYTAFISVVDYIIESKPDLVIHAGDLFDSVRPTNRAIGVAIEQLLRLSNAQIPTIVVSGNHETPKLKETGHIFRLFEHLEYVYPVYKDVEEHLYFEVKGKKVAVHAVPHCREKKNFIDALKRVKPDDSADYNILTTHGAVQSIREFRMNEFNEYVVPLSMLEKKFDYVALGHYHKHVVVHDGVVYSGSTEKMSFLEANDKKGAVEVTFNPSAVVSFLPFKTRPMFDLEPIDCKKLSLKEVMDVVQKVSSNFDAKEAIVRLSLLNLNPAIYHSIDLSSVKSMFPNAFHFELRHTATDDLEDLSTSNMAAVGDLVSEFERFVRNSSYGNKEAILELGKRYIRDAQGEEGDDT